jgi:CelD/BcsL family acetyltransferase involved in cellulose biosynthesis
MKTTVIHPRELDGPLEARWRALQQSNPALDSPCFLPEFTLAAARALPGVRIAVLEDSGEVTGFFPYQGRWGMGAPAGGGLSDHHGMVCAPGTRWDWRALLKSTGLAYWRFDHLPWEQAPAGQAQAAGSPGIDLAAGYAAWKASRVKASRRVEELDRKARKMAREVGPLRFEAHVQDPAVYDFVLRLKSHQCRRTGVPDFFAWAWPRTLVEQVLATQAPHFAGRLSALWAGDELVAAHLGMRSQREWHWWFPVYAHAQARHSPGAQLLMRVAEAAAAEGCVRLDLGKGEDAYKASFADTVVPLAEGWVSRPSVMTAVQGLRQGVGGGVVRQLRSVSWLAPLRPWVRRLRALRAGQP